MVNYWLVNHNWLSFSQTREYCGFRSDFEQMKIHPLDKIVYFGDGLVLGLFEAVELVKNEFNGWKGHYPYQIRIKLLEIPNNPPKGELQIDWLKTKFMLRKDAGGSANLMPLTEKEFDEVVKAFSQTYIP